MKKLTTWTGKKEFHYSGSVKEGTEIIYGKEHRIIIDAGQYDLLLKSFSGKTVYIGTSRDNAPAGSLGAWLQENITRTAIASYVGPILIEEGYAQKVGSHKIKIRPAVTN